MDEQDIELEEQDEMPARQNKGEIETSEIEALRIAKGLLKLKGVVGCIVLAGSTLIGSVWGAAAWINNRDAKDVQLRYERDRAAAEQYAIIDKRLARMESQFGILWRVSDERAMSNELARRNPALDVPRVAEIIADRDPLTSPPPEAR